MVLLLASSTLYLIAILAIISFVLYKLSTRNYNYWEKRGVPHLKPSPIFGNFFNVFAFRSQIGFYLGELYNKFKGPYFGIYILNTPVLILRDPDLIKCVLVKDFNYFSDRNMLSDEKCDSLASQMLFVLKNPEWKSMRTKMTPIFTTGKIKSMLALVNNAGDRMVKYLNINEKEDFIEIKEVCAKYATDVITSCAFGIEAHSFDCEDAQFRSVGRKMFDIDLKTAFRQISYFVAPGMAKLLKLPFLDPELASFLRDAFWHAIQEREKSSFKRNDLIDIIIELRKQNLLQNDVDFEGDKVVAQAAQFFAAGFETVSSTMAFTLYELSLQPKIQDRLREEIKSVVKEHNSFTYEAVQKMTYLHMVVCETLRKYPVLAFLDRMTSSNYQIPDSDMVIEKGTPIYIPLFGLHYDPQYFPDPEKYDPERFSEENKSKVPSFCYIPFGDGPRNCIGERFGLIGTKLGLVHILSNFELNKSANTPVPIKYGTKTFLLASEVGLPLNVSKVVSVAG